MCSMLGFWLYTYSTFISYKQKMKKLLTAIIVLLSLGFSFGAYEDIETLKEDLEPMWTDCVNVNVYEYYGIIRITQLCKYEQENMVIIKNKSLIIDHKWLSFFRIDWR